MTTMIDSNDLMTTYFNGLGSAIAQQNAANALSDRYANMMQEAANSLSSDYANIQKFLPQAASAPHRSQTAKTGIYKGTNGVYYAFKATLTGAVWPHTMTKMDDGKVKFAYSGQGFEMCPEDSRLTIDECEALSLYLGYCVLCGRTLTVKKSVQMGMGPVCRKKY